MNIFEHDDVCPIVKGDVLRRWVTTDEDLAPFWAGQRSGVVYIWSLVDGQGLP